RDDPGHDRAARGVAQGLVQRRAAGFHPQEMAGRVDETRPRNTSRYAVVGWQSGARGKGARVCARRRLCDRPRALASAALEFFLRAKGARAARPRAGEWRAAFRSGTLLSWARPLYASRTNPGALPRRKRRTRKTMVA